MGMAFLIEESLPRAVFTIDVRHFLPRNTVHMTASATVTLFSWWYRTTQRLRRGMACSTIEENRVLWHMEDRKLRLFFTLLIGRNGCQKQHYLDTFIVSKTAYLRNITIADPYASVLIKIPPSNIRPVVKIVKGAPVPHQ
jgi:hypothetical protein